MRSGAFTRSGRAISLMCQPGGKPTFESSKGSAPLAGIQQVIKVLGQVLKQVALHGAGNGIFHPL